jgi:hypothetical protein
MLDGYYFSIRVLVTHPSMSVADLSAHMGEQPDHSREPLDGVGAFWARTGETRGKREFFSEVSEVLTWLEGRRAEVERILATSGAIQVIVELPGDRNTGDTWEPSDMARAVELGVSLGVEVFPKIRGVTSEA